MKCSKNTLDLEVLAEIIHSICFHTICLRFDSFLLFLFIFVLFSVVCLQLFIETKPYYVRTGIIVKKINCVNAEGKKHHSHTASTSVDCTTKIISE